MKYVSHKRMAMSGVLAASMVCGVGMLIAPSSVAMTVQDAAEDLPSGAEVIKKYVEASGGEAAYKKRKSMVTKAKMEMPGMGQSIELTIYQKAPNMMATVVNLPGMGEQTTVYNGEKAWSDSAMTGPRLMTEEEMASLKRQAAMDAQYAPQNYYESIQTLSQTEFAGESAYELELVPKDGGETITQYYSVDSGLLIGQSYTQSTQQGDIEVKVIMSDYREVGGLKIPFKSKLEYPAMGMSQELTISSVEMDKEIDAKMFEVPEEIKQLEEQEKSGG